VALYPRGINANYTPTPPGAGPPGPVGGQQPQAGQQVEPATPVLLTIGSAPELPPRLTLSTRKLSFKPLLLGETAREALQLRNDGGAPLVVRSAQLATSAPAFNPAVVTAAAASDPSASAFSVSQLPAACGSLAPGASCRLILGYRPGTAGEHRSRLEITSNDPTGTLYVELSGTAWTRKPDLQVSIQKVEPVKRSAQGRLEVTVTYLVSNAGGTATGYFKVDSNIDGLYGGVSEVPAGLGPGKSQTIVATVSAPPTKTGRFELQVTVDGCGGIEFAQTYCNVDEANESNNTVRRVLQVPP
jgi:hypothetical protein